MTTGRSSDTSDWKWLKVAH